MIFEEWFATLEGEYESYKDLLRECWEAAQKEQKELK